jgi:glycerate dehydrogenase
MIGLTPRTHQPPARIPDDLSRLRSRGSGFEKVQPSPDNPLLRAKNCIVTPRLAWASKESRTRLLDAAIANLRAFLYGHPVNVVN